MGIRGNQFVDVVQYFNFSLGITSAIPVLSPFGMVALMFGVLALGILSRRSSALHRRDV